MAAPSYTSWGDVADAEPSPPATAPASNGPACPDRSSYVPPHLRNRSAGSAPPPSSARPRPKHPHSSSVDGSGLFSTGGSAFALADVPEDKKAMSPEQLAELAPTTPSALKGMQHLRMLCDAGIEHLRNNFW